MPSKKNKPYPAVVFGPLPVDLINEALGTELESGNVRLSERAHGHIVKAHADDYPICVEAIPAALAAPTYIGQAPKHGDGFELVKRLNRISGQAVLVAIGLEPTTSGEYRVTSNYLLTAEEVERKRQVGTLKTPKPKP